MCTLVIYTMKNLAEASKHDQLKFINSFDRILCDLDGVVWFQYKPIAGSVDCLNKLKGISKQVNFVSNNTTVDARTMKKSLDVCGINTDIEDIVIPSLAIVWYLKKINFNKTLFVVGSDPLMETIRNAGFSVTTEDFPKENQVVVNIEDSLEDDPDIGGVLIDIDVNVHFLKLQKAISYLRRDDCIFLSGCGDPKLPVTRNILIGPHYYIKPVVDITGRKPYYLGKPETDLNDFIVDRYNINDPKRVLFIGDSIIADLNFATKCGYQKLLVLSGLTKKEDLNPWNYPQEYKPQYYVESLRHFKNIIDTCSL